MTASPAAAASRLRAFAAWILVLNLLAAVVAVVFNWPAQFGGVGTDAGDELLARGTAISAPLLPVALLLLVVVFVGRRDVWAWLGLVAAYLAAVTVVTGGVGEMLARPTDDTPRAVLLAAGIAWSVIGAVLAVLATTAVVARRRRAR